MCPREMSQFLSDVLPKQSLRATELTTALNRPLMGTFRDIPKLLDILAQKITCDGNDMISNNCLRLLLLKTSRKATWCLPSLLNREHSRATFKEELKFKV